MSVLIRKLKKRLEVLYRDIKDDVFKEGKDGALRLFLLGQIVSLEYIRRHKTS